MRLLISSVFLIISVASCSSRKEELAEMPLYEGPVMEVRDVVSLFSDSARVRIRLQAKTQLEYETGNREFPEGIFLEFFEKDGTSSSTLTAERGEYNAKEKLYRAEGNVIVISLLNGDELNTEELFWDPMKEKIYTDKFVTIKTDEQIHTGEGMTASQDFSSYSISKATGTLPIEEPI